MKSHLKALLLLCLFALLTSSCKPTADEVAANKVAFCGQHYSPSETKKVSCRDSSTSDISPLASLSNLQKLDLSRPKIITSVIITSVAPDALNVAVGVSNEDIQKF